MISQANIFIFSVLIVGLSGLIAQALLLRELLVSFNGNELTLGIILANWIIIEALGVLCVGKFIDRVKNKKNIFILLQVFFSFGFILSLYLSRVFKSIIGIPFGEGVGLPVIFFVSFLIMLPVSFCHASLFSVSCKINSIFFSDEKKAISIIYSWETIGTILGGVAFTYILLPYLNSFQIVLSVFILNLITCLLLGGVNKKIRLALFLLCFALGSVAFSGGLKLMDNLSINLQWKGQKLLANRNSVYGNIAVTKNEEQLNFFYDGLPVITTPYPDKQFVEDFGHLPLLFHSDPKDLLVIGSGAGGLINEAIKHSLNSIDYLEIDPLIISMLKEFPTQLTEIELRAARLSIINTDSRIFLKKSRKLYDIVLIGLSNQSSLTTNRLFTQEFFSSVKNRLNVKGVLALWLPGSTTYLSQDLTDLNQSILGALSNIFPYVRIIPGDYNIILASNEKSLLEVTPDLIYKRINERHIEVNLLKKAYLDYRLNNYWVSWFNQSSVKATKMINRDFMPIAVFQSLLLWNGKFSPGINPWLRFFANIKLGGLLLLIIIITLFVAYLNLKQSRPRLSVAYSIATTGFFAMLINLVLIFGFQVLYGYAYHLIGLLISIFMFGVAVGSIIMTRKIVKIKNALNTLLTLELLIVIFSYVVATLLTHLAWLGNYSFIIFAVFLFVSGILAGSEFPLAVKLYLRDEEEIGEVSGTLYCADLLGGWLAGILGGVVLLPVLGIKAACLVIIIFKVSSAFLLLAAKKGLTRKTI